MQGVSQHCLVQWYVHVYTLAEHDLDTMWAMGRGGGVYKGFLSYFGSPL